MWIKQGDIEECGTRNPTWKGPDEEDYRKTFWKEDSSCTRTFDYTKPVDLRLKSDSYNDVHITKMAVYFGDKDVVKEWRARDEQTDNEIAELEAWANMWGQNKEEYIEAVLEGAFVPIDQDMNKGWYTTKISRPFS